jgi:hypothetical protein
MPPITVIINLQTTLKETYNEQLQPNQHPQQHHRSRLHHHFLGNLPRWYACPSPSCRNACRQHSASRLTFKHKTNFKGDLQ